MTSRVVSAALATCLGLALAAGFSGRAQAQKSGRLTDAYKREFAFLEAEKRSLAKRLEADKKDAAARIARAKDDIAALQGKVIRAAGEAERLQEHLLTAEREIDAVDTSEDVAGDILTRADSALTSAGVPMPDTLDTKTDLTDRGQVVARLELAFGNAAKALAKQGQVRIETGAYFDDAGVKVEGDILRIGGIASFGLVDGARGALAPAGGDRLKLWPMDGGEDAAAGLARGEGPSTVPVFLYEALDKGVERKEDKSVVEVIETGGIIAWVIVGLGLLALAMILARAGMLAWASRGGRRLVQPVLRHIEGRRVEQARAVVADANNPAGRVLSATLDNLDRSRDELEDVVAEAVLHEQPLLSRFGAAILVLAAVSPLMGLLGTVTGMISTFDIITEFGTGNPKLLSGGISEALVTTELGLIVAIPALLCGHILTGWSERIRDGLDGSALSVVNRAAGLTPPDDDLADAVAPSEPAVAREEIAA